ncbi:MAG: radical SAM protein [DPANN group archaeon]|nr:radical SAM protein [DPANN group archaeon]
MQEETIPALRMEEILEGYLSFESLPGYLRVQLLEWCNESCFFCHNEGYDASRVKVLDEEVMWKAISASLEIGKNKIKFTGGEPGSHPLLAEYVREIKRKSAESIVGIVTNGTYLAHNAEDLVMAGLDGVNISLHSLDREVYKKITHLDALDDVFAGLATLKSLGFRNIVINTVVNQLNLEEIPRIIAFADKEGYELHLMDWMSTEKGVEKTSVPYEHIVDLFSDNLVKPKRYHEKCEGCDYRVNCGEGEYLRLSARGTLDPCMYRDDLKIPVSLSDTPALVRKKVALGYRRIHRDTL